MVNCLQTPMIFKTKYDSEKQIIEKFFKDAENKIPHISGLVTTAALNTKATD